MDARMIGKIGLNEGFSGLVPPPTVDEYESLKQDITQNGIIYPLAITRNGILLDGYTRLRAAKELGLKRVPVAIQDLSDDDEKIRFVLRANVKRRHLTSAQRAELGLVLLEIEQERAKKRQAPGGAGKLGGKPLRPTLAEGVGRAIDIAAAEVGLSHGTLGKAAEIREAAKTDDGVKREWQKAVRGEQSVHAVHRLVARKRNERRVKAFPPPPAGEYDILLADPPWEYDFAVSVSRSIGAHYPTMPTDRIKALKVPGAADSILFLWVPAPKLREGLEVMDAWGYGYKTHMVWVKDKIGMGYYARSKHELVLIGTRGRFAPPAPNARPASVFSSPRTKHSEKPKALHHLISRMYPGRKCIELFAREKPPKPWEGYGVDLR